MLKDITLGQYFPGTSPIHRLDPRTKLILLIVYIVALFLAQGWVGYGVLLAFLLFTIKISTIPRFSRIQLCVTPWTVARQAPLSMGFSRQEYWSGLPCPPPGDLLHTGIKPQSPASPALQADSLLLGQQGSPTYTLFT